jgi:hypothetical protein
LLATKSESKQQAVEENGFGVHLVLKVANTFFDAILQSKLLTLVKQKSQPFG